MSNVKRNKFSVSYGMVVFTKIPKDSVLIVERKIPYCVHNKLIQVCKNLTNENTIKTIINSFTVKDFIHDQESLTDFIEYKYGLRKFEDRFDFPHGQMCRRAKKCLKEYEKMYNTDYYNDLVNDFAGFLTAFTEFEEESGYTFRFDVDFVKNACNKKVVLKFIAKDNFEYEQHFYIVTVDKLEKIKNKHYKNDITSHTNNIRRHCEREIDKETFIGKTVRIKDAKAIFLNQQTETGKLDFKHTLLYNGNDDNNKLTNGYNFHTDDVEENLFFEMIKKIEFDVYTRCVRRRNWRETH